MLFFMEKHRKKHGEKPVLYVIIYIGWKKKGCFIVLNIRNLPISEPITLYADLNKAIEYG